MDGNFLLRSLHVGKFSMLSFNSTATGKEGKKIQTTAVVTKPFFHYQHVKLYSFERSLK